MPPPSKCSVVYCKNKPVMKRPKTGDFMCKECFFYCFEEEIHFTIRVNNLFKRGDKIAIGASGGKDSTVLAHTLKTINDRYDYGWDLFLLSIDEGIAGYRDDSLETVKQNKVDYQLPLKILSYKDLYGWTMDEIVAQIGKKNNCTFCGVFRRQALDRGAALIGANMIATGHNADDIAETVLMNVLRGDNARLSRCTKIVTEGEGTIPRCKPLKWCYEKEIVLYAHYKSLVYFSTECTYAPNAYRGHTREFLKDLERAKPSCILDIIHSGETLKFKETVKFPARRYCVRCGFVASQEVCKACVLLEGLNTGNPRLGITKSNKAKRAMGIKVEDGSENKGRRKKEEKDPNYLSKRTMKRQLRKERRGQAPDEDENSSACQTETEAPKKETAKVAASELIPEGTSDDLSDLVLPLALYSSDEESDSAKEKKKEKIPSQNQRKSTCGSGCGSGCGSKISKPTSSSDKGKACGQGCGSSCSSKISKPQSDFKQGCGGDDFALSVDLSDDEGVDLTAKKTDESADHTEKKEDESSSRRESTAGGGYRYFTKNGEPGIPLNELFNPKYLEQAVHEAIKDLEEIRSGNYKVPVDIESSSEEEIEIDATEMMNKFRNDDIECDCPECQGDDKIGSGFINLELFKKYMEMKPIPEKDKLRIKIDGKYIDLDSLLDGPIETIIVDSDDECKKHKKPSTSDNKSNQAAPSSSADTVSDGQPSIVKANPVRKGPSILLPEMMHTTPNKLDF